MKSTHVFAFGRHVLGRSARVFFFSAKLRVGILQFVKLIEMMRCRGTKPENAVKRTANKGNLSKENKKNGKEKICAYVFFFFFFRPLIGNSMTDFRRKLNEKTGQEVSKLRLESFKKVLAPRVCSQ